MIEWLNGRLADAAPSPQAQQAHAFGLETTPRARPSGGAGGGGGGGGGGGMGGAWLSLLDCAGFESHLGLRGKAGLEELLRNSCAEQLHLACLQHLARPTHATLPGVQAADIGILALGGGVHAPAEA